MTKKTLTALRASIAHWRRLATGKRLPKEVPSAIYCPVRVATGNDFCESSPYWAAEKAARFGLDSKEFKAAARKELAFLRSLLPKKK